MRRLIGVGVVAAMLAALAIVVPATPAGAASFWDVPGSHPFADDIDWAADRYITEGYPDGSFGPGRRVTRQAYAAFAYRLAGEPRFNPPFSPTFNDVARTHPFYVEIEWFAANDIADGFPDGGFHPTATLVRQAAAAFSHRLAGEPTAPSGTALGPTFWDVPYTHPFSTQIEWFAAAEIADGYPDGSFGPGRSLVRQAIAAFLHRLWLTGLVDHDPGVPYDFDHDGRADFAYIDDNDRWRRGTAGTTFWVPDDGGVPVPGNYDGLGGSEPAVVRGAGVGNMIFETGGKRGTFLFHADVEPPGDWPDDGQTQLVEGDYDGDGQTEPAVYDQQTALWHIEGFPAPIAHGISSDVAPDERYDSAAPADYDGDGDTDIAVYRPTDGTFHVRGLGEIGGFDIGFPVPGDYDGDGVDEPSVITGCAGIWELQGGSSLTSPGDLPVPGDYDGDGADEPAGWFAETNDYEVEGMGVIALPDPPGGHYSWYPPNIRQWLVVDIIRLAFIATQTCEEDW